MNARPSIFAALGDAPGTVLGLIDRGADFTATDDAGHTPLGVARKESKERAEALLEDLSVWIQLGLAAEGFDPGPADGLVGERTRAAIRRWQTSRGEAATGYLEGESAKALLATGKQRAAQEHRDAR